MASRKNQQGVTLVEILTTVAIFFILAVIAYPSFRIVRNQMRLSEDVRTVGFILSEVRAESIRIRQPAVITFTANGFNWDIASDGTIDGSYTFNSGTTWNTIPTPITINGFGLVRGLAGNTKTITVKSGTTTHTVIINSNGHLEVA